jgi:RimJ/RimL family protein N-acetyltransferase
MDLPAEILRHDRVVLRRWRPDDLDVLTRLVDESLDWLTPWMPWAAEHSRENIADYLRQVAEKWQTGDAYNYAIMGDGPEGPNTVPVGSTSTMRRIGPGGLEIGYWIHPGWSGRGLVTMAAAAQTWQAFALPGTTHVEIHHDSENHASGAVPARLGFTKVTRAPGVRRSDVVWRIERAAAEQMDWWRVRAVRGIC